MNWRDRITLDPKILAGKPIVRGTRISVEFVVDLLGRSWTAEQILAEYDHLTREDIQACLAYAGDVLKSERIEESRVRFLANENVSATVITSLRQIGHDVLSVKESMRSAADDVILARAQSDLRIAVTHDKDFGELAFHTGLPAECGVILIRLAGPDRDADNRRAIEAIESRTDWAGHFSVVTDDRIRMRPLPSTPPAAAGPNP